MSLPGRSIRSFPILLGIRQLDNLQRCGYTDDNGKTLLNKLAVASGTNNETFIRC
jgi:hypothetical protein